MGLPDGVLVPAVTHDATAGRFEIALPEGLVRCDYRMSESPTGPVMALVHTEVPAELEGRGLASRVVQAAVDHARAEGLRIRPRCSYVVAWLRRHPEAQDLLEASKA
ncbi:MAG: N-acetyltransferase [Rubrivivax sp.]|jgi:predicted GNAT family acetyltransferase|nr:N-acetyltransferase [Rubrivivax sp.]